MQSKSIYKILTRRLLFKRLSQLLVLLFLLVSGYLFITNNAKTSRAEIINNGNTITINGGRYVVAPDGALYGNDPTVINEQLSNLSGKDVVLSSAARLIFSGADATTPTPVNINSLTLQGGSEITHVGPGPTDRLLVGDKIQTDADNATAFSTDTAYELNGDMRGRIVPRDYFGVILEGWFVVPNGITTIAVQFDDAARIYLGQSDTLSATVSLPAYIINADVGANGYSTLNGLTPGGIYHYKIYYLNSLNNGHLRFCTTYNKGETCSVALSNNNFFISKEAAEQNLASGRARAKLQLYDDSIDPRNFEGLDTYLGLYGPDADSKMRSRFNSTNIVFVDPLFQVRNVFNISDFFNQPIATAAPGLINTDQSNPEPASSFTAQLSYKRGIYLTVAGKINLRGSGGGKINADEVGYMARFSPEGRYNGDTNTTLRNGAAGGSYGGVGGLGYTSGTASSRPIASYGDYTNPIDYGSGSGCYGSGGGLIIINTDSIEIDPNLGGGSVVDNDYSGVITANGRNGYFGQYHKCGGGAGGSINITTNSLYISNRNGLHRFQAFSAIGGIGGPDDGNIGNEPGGGGGGGRVAIRYKSVVDNGDLNNFERLLKSVTEISGGGGKYEDNMGRNGTLFIDDMTSSPTVTKTLEAVSRTLSNGTTITDFNPYSMQVGDTIKVTLNVLGIRGGETLIDNALLYNAPTTSKDFICRPQRFTANPEPSVPINATSNSVTWNADTSVTSYYYECIVQEMP